MPRRFPIQLLSIVLFLGLIFSASADAGKKKRRAKPVALNTATSEELQQVPGIGPATAEKILQMRKSYGPFKSVDDLLAIRGLGAKRLEKMRKYLTAGKPNSKNAAPATGCSGRAKPKVPPGKSPIKTSAQPASSQTAGGSRRATTLDAEGKSRFLASLGMTDGSGSCVLDHKVWCVGLGWSMRRGTWSAMRMP